MQNSLLRNRLEKLFLKNYEKWCLIAYTYVKNRDDAEEVVHQVCYNVLDRKKISPIDNLDSYIVVAIRNTSLKKIEKEKFIKGVDISELPEKQDIEEDSCFSFERKQRLRKAISELPVASRKIFELCVIQGEKYHTVAETMNLSINTIKYHIKKCYKILKVELTEN